MPPIAGGRLTTQVRCANARASGADDPSSGHMTHRPGTLLDRPGAPNPCRASGALECDGRSSARLCAAFVGLLTLAGPGHAADLTITFPDGSTAKIHVRATPRWRIASSDGPPLWSIYAELREEAERGDATAAFALGNALRRCWSPP